MDEINKLNTIRPVEPRTTDRPEQGKPAEPGKFDEMLQGEFARMDNVKNAASAPNKTGAGSESTAIQDEIREANRMYQDMMKAKQVLSQIYHSQVAESSKAGDGEDKG